ncbi:hypothetical protein AGDE_01427 [Angomonas deanei]|nr:hypothetical protein AGDE_01427 [Angomonas deanei]|eukprot:EPY42496.1 hypothetical protein AGDE_01427 [Angomonas deanei]
MRSYLRPDPNDTKKKDGQTASSMMSQRGATAASSTTGSQFLPEDAPENPPVSSTYKETALLFPEAHSAAFDPKVQIPYEHERGRVPRNIEIERRRRLFDSQDLSHLLKISKLDLVDLAEKRSDKLPLELFDDTSYDCRNPEEWMEIANSNPNDEGKFLPAEGITQVNDVFTIQPCRVVGWDQEKNAVEVKWGPTSKDSQEVQVTPRIFVRLLAEDPIMYVQRLLNAHSQREKAMSWSTIPPVLRCDAHGGTWKV